MSSEVLNRGFVRALRDEKVFVFCLGLLLGLCLSMVHLSFSFTVTEKSSIVEAAIVLGYLLMSGVLISKMLSIRKDVIAENAIAVNWWEAFAASIGGFILSTSSYMVFPQLGVAGIVIAATMLLTVGFTFSRCIAEISAQSS